MRRRSFQTDSAVTFTINRQEKIKVMKIGIDLGGTNIAGGLVSDDGTLVLKKSVPTDSSRGELGICEDIVSLIRALSDETDEKITSVGIGVPGFADDRTGVVIYCNNIPFANTHLAEYVTRETSLPAFIGNDANAAVLAEARVGIAKDYENVVMITLGTGIGSGLIFNNKLFTGCNGAAGELGHVSLFPDGIPCTCGRNGCYELYASATALKRQTQEAMEKHPESILWDVAKSTGGVTGKTAFDAMRAGDETGKAVVDGYINYLSLGLVDVVNLLQPDVVIFGGGISKEGETLLAPLREIIHKKSYCSGGKYPELLIAKLGNDAGIIGAAYFGE